MTTFGKQGRPALSRLLLLGAAVLAAGWVPPSEAAPKKNTETKTVNRLAQSKSSYLRSAAGQPVAWYEWGDEAFRAAKQQDKPVLLDIGAVWCHWCHVIDRESYENPEIAKMINELFIPVKVDVDARPDIDRRYQEVVQALTGQGGWPLTAFLTPEGEVIYGGTYFPPEDRQGMPGMKTILARVSQVYKEKKEDVTAQAKQLHRDIAQVSSESIKPGELSPGILDQIVANIMERRDEEHGGFGEAPKFPAPTAVELLMRRHLATGDKSYLDTAAKALDAMALGGIRDHLGGAMHRYSTDSSWRVPHFEVMLYLEGEILKIYAQAYQLTGNQRYADVGREITAYLSSTLSDQAKGGFYGSQDADFSPEDDGDYWTWTLDEAQQVLSEEEFEAVRLYFGIEERGEMRENPAKNVLYEAMPAAEVAKKLNKTPEEINRRIAGGKRKLLAARSRRETPFVDKTVYVNWNGLMVSGYLAASSAFNDQEARVFALKTLDRIWKEGIDPKKGLCHILEEGGARTVGFLEDYAYLSNAFLDAYEVTQQDIYLERAGVLADQMVKRFGDNEAGGFFDAEIDPNAIAVLRTRRKPVQDSPTPGANSAAALVMARLFHYTGQELYKQTAEETLASFAGTAREHGFFAASFGIALESYLEEPLHIVVVGKPDDQRTGLLLKAVEGVYRPNRVVQAADAARGGQGLPPALAELLRNVGALNAPTAFVCAGASCAAPTGDPEQLKKLVQTFGLTQSGAIHGG